MHIFRIPFAKSISRWLRSEYEFYLIMRYEVCCRNQPFRKFNTRKNIWSNWIKKSRSVSSPDFCQHRSSQLLCSVKKGVLRNFPKFLKKHLCQNLFFNKVAGQKPATFIKKETLAHVFFCEFCEISQNTFPTEHLQWLLLSITYFLSSIKIHFVFKKFNQKSQNIPNLLYHILLYYIASNYIILHDIAIYILQW